MQMPSVRNLSLRTIVLGVAALVVTASLLQTLAQNRDDGATSSPQAQQASSSSTPDPAPGPTFAVDVGQLDSPTTAPGCLTPGFASDPARVDVLYGVLQRRPGGSSPVYVVRNENGAVRLCDQFGADRSSQDPLPTVSDERPIAFLSNGRSSWQCDGERLRRLHTTSWLLVSPEISTLQQRFYVDGRPGPWFTTRAQSGLAHLQAWLNGPEPAGTKYAVQYRALDASGHEVSQSVLPTQRQAMPGCAGDGSAQVG